MSAEGLASSDQVRACERPTTWFVPLLGRLEIARPRGARACARLRAWRSAAGSVAGELASARARDPLHGPPASSSAGRTAYRVRARRRCWCSSWDASAPPPGAASATRWRDPLPVHAQLVPKDASILPALPPLNLVAAPAPVLTLGLGAVDQALPVVEWESRETGRLPHKQLVSATLVPCFRQHGDEVQ
jgi:hypothetical protein